MVSSLIRSPSSVAFAGVPDAAVALRSSARGVARSYQAREDAFLELWCPLALFFSIFFKLKQSFIT